MYYNVKKVSKINISINNNVNFLTHIGTFNVSCQQTAGKLQAGVNAIKAGVDAAKARDCLYRRDYNAANLFTNRGSSIIINESMHFISMQLAFFYNLEQDKRFQV